MTQVTDHLNHSTWECKYHVVFTPKYRKKALLVPSAKSLKTYFIALPPKRTARSRKGIRCRITCTCISIPPKLAVASVVGFLKGKSSIWVAQNIAGKRQNFVGHKFWARGYHVSTVGADEKTIRAYIRNQESEDKRLDELSLFDRSK